MRARTEISVLAAFAVAALGLLLFAEITDDASNGEAHRFDRMILLALRTPGDLADPVGPPWLELAVRDVTSLGGYIILMLMVACVSVYLAAAGKWRHGALLAGAVVSGSFLSEALKSFFGRPRPDLVTHLAEVTSLSFPSGHAMISAIAYLTMGALLTRFHERRRLKVLAMSFAVIITILVGLSRIYLGVHWPSDVLAGWFLGAVWAALWWLVAWRFLR
ncbi:phosphatase PAP2 family protein [Hyphococcus flavus]|uniref:Phosphatase PAP2 family protein n=1 Tax=Hyphococcus flavus TaxID=1866326 RepID=A0AAE9ZAE1_9PROT|nr:phosphatase PAP2 family protein [Hyphococcus flavus]WDI30639.1 phosphatase PAP2 family protein [Hyphococcus flavus]